MVNNCRILYYVIKKGRPLNDVNDLISLVAELSGNVSQNHYNNNRITLELLQSLNNIQQQSDINLLRKTKFFSINTDGHTHLHRTAVTLFFRFVYFYIHFFINL